MCIKCIKCIRDYLSNVIKLALQLFCFLVMTFKCSGDQMVFFSFKYKNPAATAGTIEDTIVKWNFQPNEWDRRDIAGTEQILAVYRSSCRKANAKAKVLPLYLSTQWVYQRYTLVFRPICACPLHVLTWTKIIFVPNFTGKFLSENKSYRIQYAYIHSSILV